MALPDLSACTYNMSYVVKPSQQSESLQDMIPAAGIHADPFADTAPGSPGNVKAGRLGQPASTALGLAPPMAPASALGRTGPEGTGQDDDVSHGRALLERAMLGDPLPEFEAQQNRANGMYMWLCCPPCWSVASDWTCHVPPCSLSPCCSCLLAWEALFGACYVKAALLHIEASLVTSTATERQRACA